MHKKIKFGYFIILVYIFNLFRKVLEIKAKIHKNTQKIFEKTLAFFLEMC